MYKRKKTVKNNTKLRVKTLHVLNKDGQLEKNLWIVRWWSVIMKYLPDNAWLFLKQKCPITVRSHHNRYWQAYFYNKDSKKRYCKEERITTTNANFKKLKKKIRVGKPNNANSSLARLPNFGCALKLSHWIMECIGSFNHRPEFIKFYAFSNASQYEKFTVFIKFNAKKWMKWHLTSLSSLVE